MISFVLLTIKRDIIMNSFYQMEEIRLTDSDRVIVRNLKRISISLIIMKEISQQSNGGSESTETLTMN